MASQNSKKKRSAYDGSLKLKVIGYAEIHGNRTASREFTVPETNVIVFILIVCLPGFVVNKYFVMGTRVPHICHL